MRIREQGFTLVEMLVYLAIFVTVATASVTLMISLSTFVDQYRIETRLYRSGTSIMEQVLLAARQADQVVLTGTELATSTAGRVQFENSATTTDFILENNTVTLTINGEAQGSLTSSGVVVDGFTVYRYDTTNGELVRVRLDMTSTNNGVTRSLSVQGGAVIRSAI